MVNPQCLGLLPWDPLHGLSLVCATRESHQAARRRIQRRVETALVLLGTTLFLCFVVDLSPFTVHLEWTVACNNNRGASSYRAEP